MISQKKAKLADNIQGGHPLAAEVLQNETYVDDVLAGAHDVPTAKMVRDELIASVEYAGFSLRKWASKVLSVIPKERLLNNNLLSFTESNSTIRYWKIDVMQKTKNKKTYPKCKTRCNAKKYKSCVLHKKIQTIQMMAALPTERFTLTRPLAATNIDFAGPNEIKNYTGRAYLITKTCNHTAYL